MNILVACEYSAIVREAFEKQGHNAYSCDLLPTEGDENFHYLGDVFDIINGGFFITQGGTIVDVRKWDLMIAHPPCTRLCNSGVRWLHNPPKNKNKNEIWQELKEGAELFSRLWNSDIEKICIENPVMHKHAKNLIKNYEKFEQSIQPWQFGHGEVKRTCLWLKNLKPLTSTNIVEGREARVHMMSPGVDRWKERSRFFTGVAEAMAQQWGEK